MTTHVTADEYFAIVPEWVLFADVSSNAVRLYAVLRRYADDSGQAHPSRKTLANRMHCSVDTIDRAMRELVEIEAVLVVNREVAGSKERDTNVYRVYTVRRRGRTDAATPGRSDAATGGGTGAATGGRKDAAENHSQLNQSHRNQKTPVLSSNEQQVIDQAFELFWTTYPRRTGKDEARRAFERRVLGTNPKRYPPASIDTILEGVRRFAADPNLPRELAYVPLPATWLNQGRWADDPLPPRTDDHPAGREPSIDETVAYLEDVRRRKA